MNWHGEFYNFVFPVCKFQISVIIHVIWARKYLHNKIESSSWLFGTIPFHKAFHLWCFGKLEISSSVMRGKTRQWG